MKSNIELPNESNSLPMPRPPPSQSSFSSLPDDIVLSILARIPISYYSGLSLVSKSFRSLILSKELDKARLHLGTREKCLYVCLQSPTNPCDHRWFSLWINPDDHQTLTHYTTQDKSTGNLLVPVPSFYSPRLPISYNTVGSDIYEISGQNTPSSSTDMWVYNKLAGRRCKAPSMMVPRRNALTCAIDEKIYVMGGCEADESLYWAEVFDPKTQTWEPLPDPGAELRFSSIKKLEADPGKVYVKTKNKNFVYLIQESRWDVAEVNLGESTCDIENVRYSYDDKKCCWYDTKCDEWRLVKGLSELDRHFRIDATEIGNFGGKLVMFWVGPTVYPLLDTPEIWCAVILLEKRHDGEVWGQIEWEDVVLRVPWSHTLLRCVHSLQ